MNPKVSAPFHQPRQIDIALAGMHRRVSCEAICKHMPPHGPAAQATLASYSGSVRSCDCFDEEGNGTAQAPWPVQLPTISKNSPWKFGVDCMAPGWRRRFLHRRKFSSSASGRGISSAAWLAGQWASWGASASSTCDISCATKASSSASISAFRCGLQVGPTRTACPHAISFQIVIMASTSVSRRGTWSTKGRICWSGCVQTTSRSPEWVTPQSYNTFRWCTCSYSVGDDHANQHNPENETK